MKNKTKEADKLAKEFSTPARELKAIQQGNKILEPLLFEKEDYFHKFSELKLQSALKPLLKQAIESKQTFDFDQLVTEACQDLKLDPQWAIKYFKSPRYLKWYKDRVTEIEGHLGLSVEYLANKHKDNLEGRINLTSGQLDSAKELGDRIWPKVSKIEHEISQKEMTTLDDLPDYEKKVNDLEKRFRDSIPGQVTDAA